MQQHPYPVPLMVHETSVGFTCFGMARDSSLVTRTYSSRGRNLVGTPCFPTSSVIMARRLLPTLFTVVSVPTSNSLSLSELSKVSNTLTVSSPMIDSSVHTLFLSPASSIPVAISNLSQVFLQDFHRLDADLSFMFRGFDAGIILFCNHRQNVKVGHKFMT